MSAEWTPETEARWERWCDAGPVDQAWEVKRYDDCPPLVMNDHFERVAQIAGAHIAATNRLRDGIIGFLIGASAVAFLVSLTSDAEWWRFASALALGAGAVILSGEGKD